MKIDRLHRWPTTAEAAVRLQNRLRAASGPDALPLRAFRWVAGADVSYDRRTDTVFGGVVLIDTASWETVEERGVVAPSPFPYVPGLLSFRELPVLLAAFGRLERSPEVVLFDGQGRAHPRRLGLATHAGLWLRVPTVGCAKSRLIGAHREPGRRRGAHVALWDKDPTGRRELLGRVVRTRDGCRPVYVSIGWGIRLEDAVRAVLRCGRGYRLPEPTRRAHHYVNRLRRGERPG
jgi:deoxyribonuclease V